MRLSTWLLFFFFLQTGAAQVINPAWEQVTGLTGKLRAMGYSQDKMLAISNKGIFNSRDKGLTWLKTHSFYGVGNAWARNNALFVQQANNVFPASTGYTNATEWRLYRSINGGPFQSIYSYLPQGSFNTQYSTDLAFADDTTLCRIDRTTNYNQVSTFHLFLSSDLGTHWDYGHPFDWLTKIVGRTKESLVLFRANQLNLHHLDASGAVDTVDLPMIPTAAFRGGFTRSDSITVCFSDGQWWRYVASDSSWSSGILPFSNVYSVWLEEGYCYIHSSEGLLRASDLSGQPNDYQWINDTEKIFRAGNYFFKQTDYCPITENRNMGDTLGWQPVPMLGLEDEASLWEKGGHVFANTLCPHELCGNVFQPAPGATLPPAFFELSPYYFRQIPIDTTSAVLRSTDRELSWDTILINPGFLGSFQKGRQRLFFI